MSRPLALLLILVDVPVHVPTSTTHNLFDTKIGMMQSANISNIYGKWVWPCHAPQGDPTIGIPEKNGKNLSLATRCLKILKKYPTSIFAKNGCGPAKRLRVTQQCLNNFEKISNF